MEAKKKKIIGISIFLIVTVVVLYFWAQKPEGVLNAFGIKKSIPAEWKADKFEPSSQIRSPLSDSWQNKDFYIKVLDEDLESGINSDSCAYKAFSYNESSREYSSAWYQRECNSAAGIGVGENKWCGQEGRNSCWIYVSSEDRAGNRHEPSQEKGSIVNYSIDWSAPEVGQVSIGSGKAEVIVKDNLKVAGCNLYYDNKDLGTMSFLVPGCEKECQAFMNWNVKLEPGSHNVLAACRDAAGNFSWGKESLLKENQKPEIVSCRVSPSQGKVSSDFKFFLEASDPDQDSLNFSWSFGDEASSTAQYPVHRYSKTGTFEPRIEISDGKGGKDTCSTAWVVVGE